MATFDRLAKASVEGAAALRVREAVEGGVAQQVEQVRGVPGVGQTWLDVTKPGLRARMETIEFDRPHRLSR